MADGDDPERGGGILDYAAKGVGEGRRRSVPAALAAVVTCCVAVYMVYEMRVLSVEALAVSGSDCGTCRRGPMQAAGGLIWLAAGSVMGPVVAWRDKAMLPVARVAAVVAVYAWFCALYGTAV